MAVVLNITIFDFGGYFTTSLPILIGRIFVPPPPSGSASAALATVVTVPPTPFTLTFTSASVPPTGISAVLITEMASGGDLLRSGVVVAFPSPPVNATLFTVPPVLVPASALASAATSISILPTVVPAAVQVACGAITAGTFIPLFVVMPPVSLTLGAGSITLAATGFLVVRTFFFGVTTYTFTFTATFVVSPSGDPTNTGRVLRLTPSTSSLTGIPFPANLVVASFIAGLVASFGESVINKTILTRAMSVLATLGFRTTPTAVFSARKVTISPGTVPTGGGMNLQLVLADLSGPAIFTPPRTMSVSIAPTPVAVTSQTYTVTVSDMGTGSPIAGADVTLHNFSVGGVAAASVATTDAQGHAIFNIALHWHTIRGSSVDIGTDGKPHHDPDDKQIQISPTLSVTANGYTSVTMRLL